MSGTVNIPGKFEKRTVIGTPAPCRCGALVNNEALAARFERSLQNNTLRMDRASPRFLLAEDYILRVYQLLRVWT